MYVNPQYFLFLDVRIFKFCSYSPDVEMWPGRIPSITQSFFDGLEFSGINLLPRVLYFKHTRNCSGDGLRAGGDSTELVDGETAVIYR